jgi:hypothetical protein
MSPPFKNSRQNFLWIYTDNIIQKIKVQIFLKGHKNLQNCDGENHFAFWGVPIAWWRKPYGGPDGQGQL